MKITINLWKMAAVLVLYCLLMDALDVPAHLPFWRCAIAGLIIAIISEIDCSK